MKKCLLIILSTIFTLSLCGCGVPAATESTIGANSPILTIAVSQSSTAEPTPSPTDDLMQEKFYMAPDIEGLTKAIEEKDGIQKVVYRYAADNPYGGVEGEYAGEFKKEVDRHKQELIENVGGVVLMPEVVKSIFLEVNDSLGEWWSYCPIPLDISSLGEEDVVVEYGTFSYGGWDNVDINFDKVLPLVCIAFGRDDIKTDFMIAQLEDGGTCLCDSLAMIQYQPEGVDEYSDREIVSRLFSFGGNLGINTEGLALDEWGHPIVGQFDYGEFICEVNSHLVLRKFYGGPLNGPLQLERENGCFVFMCIKSES